MEDRKTTLLEEVRQLLQQYRAEVPGRRRAWPESIKSRAFELRSLGKNFTQIAEETGLPYFTLLKWHKEKKSPGFAVVKLVKSRKAIPPETGTVTESVSTRTERVTVTVGAQIRIEEVSLDFLLSLLPKLGVTIP